MSGETLLRGAGALQIALALLHVGFPKRFRWKEELATLSLLNRQIFYVHTFFICWTLVLFGALSLLAPGALLEGSRLSQLVLGGIASFWGLRLLFQFFVYDTQLWQGDRFRTWMHALFTLLWSYFAGVYGWLWYLSFA